MKSPRARSALSQIKDRHSAHLKAALEEIANHWANNYDAPQFGKEAGSSYTIGVVDGHRLCASIARAALEKPEDKQQLTQ